MRPHPYRKFPRGCSQDPYACEDIALARRRLRDLERRIETTLDDHEVGKLLTTIDGIGPQTAARLVAEIGDFQRFANLGKLAAYVGSIPGLKHSGKSKPNGAMSFGHARLRRSLWMPLLTAVRKNAWLRAYYQRLAITGAGHCRAREHGFGGDALSTRRHNRAAVSTSARTRPRDGACYTCKETAGARRVESDEEADHDDIGGHALRLMHRRLVVRAALVLQEGTDCGSQFRCQGRSPCVCEQASEGPL
jgi:hypothetical protein